MASKLEILLSAKDLASKVFATLEDNVTKSSKKLTRFGDAAQDAGNKMSIGLTAPILGLGVVSFNAASDMAESMSKTQVVFGETAGSIEQFASRAATSMGMGKQAALEATGTFGNLFKAMGLGNEPAATMSTGLVQLAGDLASFNNLDPTEVLEKLRSGIVGETEPLRALGVNMNAARIEAEALALGIVAPVENMAKITAATNNSEKASQAAAEALKKHGAESQQYRDAAVKVLLAEEQLSKAMEGKVPELTAAQKAQAAYSIIMKDTSLAQGDFARTADGAANSGRILKAKVSDLQAEMGEKLLPVGLKVIDMASSVTDKFAGLSSEQQTAILVTGGLLAVLGPLTTAIGTAAQVVGVLTAAKTHNTAAMIAHKAATVAVTVAQGAMTAAQWLLNAALTANPIGLVVVVLAALAAGIIYAYQNSETFRNVVDAAFTIVKTVVKDAIDAAAGSINWLGDRIGWLIGKARELLDWLGRIPGVGKTSAQGLPGFATGGSFVVGGAGGTDSQLVAFRATPGEEVSISRPGQRSGGLNNTQPGATAQPARVTYITVSGVGLDEVASEIERRQRRLELLYA